VALGYLVVALVAAAVAVFALQNSDHTSVRFLAWTVEGLPVAAVALASLGTGLLVAGLPLWIKLLRWRSRARSLESRVAGLERSLAERDQALLRQPPAPSRPVPRPEPQPEPPAAPQP